MRRLGSLVMRVADEARVPAGAALAVDRERFAERITEAVAAHPLDHRSSARRCGRSPARSADAAGDRRDRAAHLRRAVRGHRGARRAGAPLLLRRDQPDRAGRDDRPRRRCSARRAGAGACAATGSARTPVDARAAGARASDRLAAPACGVDDGEGDYLNCPFTRDEYERVLRRAGRRASRRRVHDFDKAKFFEGCLPIEVMAHRGRDTLRFGPMKPVGLVDPRTGRQPYAVVQLRQDNLAGDHFSLVGLPDADEVGRAGARASADSRASSGPSSCASAWCTATRTSTGRRCCARRGRCATRPALFFAGQISGVEGYVESAASGLLAGINAAALAPGAPPSRAAADDGDRRAGATTSSHADPRHYQPTQHHLRHHGAARGGDRRRAATARRATRRSRPRALDELARWARQRVVASGQWQCPRITRDGWPLRTVHGPLTALGVRDLVRDFLDLPAAESQRVAAHGARVRERPRRSSSRSSPDTASGRGPSCSRPTSRGRRSAGSSAELLQAGASRGRRRRASWPPCGRSCATCGARA